ncbi:MAG: helix-turn-helix domain-containing protein, partial [Methylococcaceae bacterium]|nr:helix-turn-helix domain-containing protein [Methylococcaceae bacterium]
RFRGWNRMMAAFGRLHAGDSLTRAALEAGFADSAHFSHSFRATFGVNPAPVFRGLRRFDAGL